MYSDLIDFLSGSGKRCIAVVEAYFDESGTHTGAQMLCVAGYVGSRREWYKFENEFQGSLEAHKITCFHAKNPQCAPLNLPLASAIEKRNLIGSVCAVDPNIFKLHTNVQFKSLIGNAYAVCTFMCALNICEWAKENKLGPVSFVYELGQPNADFIQRTLEALSVAKIDPIWNIAGVMGGKRIEFVPLQAADFLAHLYSTNDTNWLAYLSRSGKIKHTILGPTSLSEVSDMIRMAFHQRQLIRKRNKRIKNK